MVLVVTLDDESPKKAGRNTDDCIDLTEEDVQIEEPNELMIKLCRDGLVNSLVKLLNQGYDANLRDSTKNTLLHHASATGQLEIVNKLLNYGALPNVVNSSYLTPLHLASLNGFTEVVRELLRYNADENFVTNLGESALDLAARNGKLETVKELLKAGMDTNTVIDKLPSSWSENHFEIVVEILKSYYYPLHRAIWIPSISSVHRITVMKRLLRSGISPDDQDVDGETALHLTLNAAFYNIELFKILLDYGADFNIKTNKGQSVLNLCKLFHRKDAMELILSKINNENSQDPNKKPIQITLEDCVICNGHREEIFTLYPCGHAKTCEMCCVKLIASPDIQSVCPICRGRIDDYKKIYV